MPAYSNNLLLFNLDVVEPLPFLIRLKKKGIKKNKCKVNLIPCGCFKIHNHGPSNCACDVFVDVIFIIKGY